jgi:hypothetical protein
MIRVSAVLESRPDMRRSIPPPPGILRRASLAVALAILPAPGAGAQDDPVYQTEERFSLRLSGDALARGEWTRDVFVDPGVVRDEDRQRGQLRPRLELGIGRLVLGVGGEFNYSSDRNVDPRPALARDNYDSRGARLDLAFASLRPTSWLRVEGGRFFMPIALTELVWDRDLRPQGAALTLSAGDRGALKRAAFTLLGARGSHVFDDGDTTLVSVAGDAELALGERTSLELLLAWLDFSDIRTMEPMIRRQNRRAAGQLVGEYRVLDAVARLRLAGSVPLQLVADACVNTAVDDERHGLWLSAVLGSTRTASLRAEYTFAHVDRDATLAAYASDDFFWATGWRGHRGDLGIRLGERSALHLVGQLQRFKDAPRPEERGHWNKRVRAELRITFGPRS